LLETMAAAGRIPTDCPTLAAAGDGNGEDAGDG
jgi:hypothetical protein